MTSVTQQSPGAGNPYNGLYREAQPERRASFRVQVDGSILLPLHPASLTHKQHQRCKIIHSMRPMVRKGRSIDVNLFFVEYPVQAISVAVLVAVV